MLRRLDLVKILSRLLAVVVVLSSLFLLVSPTPPSGAQGPGSELFFPIIYRSEQVLFDDFEDQVPMWTWLSIKGDPKDGDFVYQNGKLVARAQDNSLVMIATPGWRPRGDFALEVEGRFSSPERGQYVNSLGLAFGGNDDWTEFYAYLLTYDFAQPQWAVARVKWRADQAKWEWTYLDDFDGAPSHVRGWDGTNRLQVIRAQNEITVWCNGELMPMPDGRYIDGTYGTNRQVGVIVTVWELSWGEMEFDNFKLTPLSMPY